MIELGKRSECIGEDSLVLLEIVGRPCELPRHPAGHKVICSYDDGSDERLFVCESLKDMQQMYDGFARSGARGIKWYWAENPGFTKLLP
jgi:hypothetical protein